MIVPCIRRRGRRCVAAASAVAMSAVVLSGCSSSGSAGGGSNDTVRLALKGPATIEADIYLAQEKGLFAKHHINLKITYNNPPSALLVARRADLAIDSPSLASLVVTKGKDLKQIVSESQDAFIGLLATPKVKTIDQLKALGSDCRIASQSPGGSGYGFTLHYIETLGLKCKVVTVPNQPDALNGVVSGLYTAVAKTGGDPAATAAVGKGANWLADPANPADVKQYGLSTQYLTTAVFGTPGYLSSHKKTVVDFLSAILEAQQMAEAMSDTDLATVVHNLDAFKQFSVAALASQIGAFRSFLKYGPISDAVWSDSLKTYSEWKVPGFNESNPKLAFNSAVDNSYVEAAQK